MKKLRRKDARRIKRQRRGKDAPGPFTSHKWLNNDSIT